MGESSLYAYGVIEREGLEFDTSGVNGADTAYTVDHPPLSAVVTDIDTVEPERTEENARAHNEVLQQILQHSEVRAVVPMQFGMAFKNEETLKNLLNESAHAFTQVLEEVEGKVELGLKVLNPAGEDVDEDTVRNDVEERFDDLATTSTRGDMFSDMLVVNRSFLVEREEQGAFNEAVGEFQEAHDDLLVHYTGPWAPYSFVDIKIGAKQP